MGSAWERKAGVLLPVFSLSSRYGIGTFGREARSWIRSLAEAGFHYWQVLPLGPTSYGDSPYQSFSAFAGNPYFIDPEELVEINLLSREEIESFDFGDDPSRVSYDRLYQARFRMLRLAFSRALHTGAIGTRFLEFRRENAEWLSDYALFMSLKNHYEGKGWLEWPEDIRCREPEALAAARASLADDCIFWEFVQFLFFEQWAEVRRCAAEEGIEIIGDIPIYCAMDSADVWAHPDLFLMDENHRPEKVAGVPPDYFSEDGQLWGNPLYRWDAHRADGYRWWTARMRNCARLYDCVRIDHFIGIVRYYSIDYGAVSAKEGKYHPGPGREFLRVLREAVPETRLIAEDLGVIVPEVQEVLDASGFPGMKVLAFAFGSGPDNDYLPHNFTDTNSVVYIGTHDNDTAAGMLEAMVPSERAFFDEYCGLEAPEVRETAGEEERETVPARPEEIRALIRLALSSVSDTAILQAQDLLGLGTEARVNTPSTLGGNWCWRLLPGQTHEMFGEVSPMLKLYRR